MNTSTSSHPVCPGSESWVGTESSHSLCPNCGRYVLIRKSDGRLRVHRLLAAQQDETSCAASLLEALLKIGQVADVYVMLRLVEKGETPLGEPKRGYSHNSRPEEYPRRVEANPQRAKNNPRRGKASLMDTHTGSKLNIPPDTNLRTEEMRRYLDTLFGDRSGALHFAVGNKPYFNAAGAYRFDIWVPEAIVWPFPEIDALIELLLNESEEGDVYMCPYLMVGDKRAKGLAVDHFFSHADIDREPFDSVKAEKLDSLGGFAIASGSDDHVHAYVPLAESVSAPQHEALCRGLGDFLGGADPGKCSDNDVLRPPGTFNHKPRLKDGEPIAPVRWLP